MSGMDPLIRSQVVFCRDYGLVLNQNLVQDVQGLSLSYALKIAGPKNFFTRDALRGHTVSKNGSISFLFFSSS